MDSFTHNLVQAFLKLGSPVNVIRIIGLDLETVQENLGNYLVLSPGPKSPKDYPILQQVIGRFLGKIPILGVCLGFQAINQFFGGNTVRSAEIIHGKSVEIFHDKSGVFYDIPSPTRVARYHSLKVSSISSKLSIQSVYNEIVMAFRYPEKCISGIQFHPESFLTVHGLLMLKNYLEGQL